MSPGAEDDTWVEPADDSVMQTMMVRALLSVPVPCYICSKPVGWGEGKAWCSDHQPVWSRDGSVSPVASGTEGEE